MLVAVFTLEYQKGFLLELQQIKDTHFWAKDFMNNQEKRLFTLSANAVIILHLILWCLALTVVVIATVCYTSFASIMYNDNWSYFNKILHKILSTIFVTFAYFIGNTQECYFAHMIVHGYLQMGILTAHFRQEIGKYKKIQLIDKIHSKVYQSEVKRILKRCISHYQQLKTLVVLFLLIYLPLPLKYFRYGSIISISASKVAVLHFLSAVIVLAVGLNIIIFVSTTSNYQPD